MMVKSGMMIAFSSSPMEKVKRMEEKSEEGYVSCKKGANKGPVAAVAENKRSFSKQTSSRTSC